MQKPKTLLARAVVRAGVVAAALVGVELQWSVAFAGPTITHGQIGAPPAGAPASLTEILKRVSPAVVQIEARQRVRGQDGQGGETHDSYVIVSGAGFLISPDGYVVATGNVVGSAEEITVTMADKREFKAHMVGRDTWTDLAVLKVDGKDFPFVEFEARAEPRVGDWVVAIGNPSGLGSTAKAGVVSAYGHDLGEKYVDYVQIEADIARGDAGAPAFDVNGRVIGVVAAMLKRKGSSAYTGVAVSAEVANRITRELIASGKIQYGHMGLTIGPGVRLSLGLPDNSGAYIIGIEPNGPAARADLRLGDVIEKVNDQDIASSSDFVYLLTKTRAGEVLHLDVLRTGKLVKLDVELGANASQ